MKHLVLLFLVCTASVVFSQKKLHVQDFTTDQKAEWEKFTEFWWGNGNGTCFPMMQAQIDSAGCTNFAIWVDLTIDKNGAIKRVKLRKSEIFCINKSIQKELEECFLSALKDPFAEFKYLKGCKLLQVKL